MASTLLTMPERSLHTQQRALQQQQVVLQQQQVLQLQQQASVAAAAAAAGAAVQQSSPAAAVVASGQQQQQRLQLLQLHAAGLPMWRSAAGRVGVTEGAGAGADSRSFGNERQQQVCCALLQARPQGLHPQEESKEQAGARLLL